MNHPEKTRPQSYLRIVHVTKTFGDLVAVDDFSLDVKEGEFVCLLGPSGCGKTTLLRIIAGLEQQNAGEVHQGDTDISRLPPRRRDFGIVFQSYALFPNLTAARNIAYGLESRRLPKQEIDVRVTELLELVGLPGVGPKYPSQLSGGQQQRIALARALAPSPGLLLLDEPLSALDARVRVSLRMEIKHLQRRVGVTTIFVTHDQEEALVMADRIVVMNGGHTEQVDTPEEIYVSPATPFVADFIGVMNFLPGVAGTDPDQVRCGEIKLRCTATHPHNLAPHTPIVLAIRPEDVRLGGADLSAPNIATGYVEEIEFLGSFYRLTFHLDGLEEAHLVAEVSINRMRDLNIEAGNSLPVRLPPSLVRVYPASMMSAIS
ncbi:MAG: putative 2-aminoethylphosphonate ABC transporter ATP-binding protein [Chloroflexota bacterium]|nr:putative 2-aminoethylphosphonate ABC transporter ATP-binding protein [Chloroflexota bacterium]